MNRTAIGWTDWTLNIFSGCKKISPECAHCYAHTFSERHRGNAAFPHGFDLTVRPHMLKGPARVLKSDGPGLIFCESMSDIGLHDDELDGAEVDRLFAAGFASMDHLRDAFFDMIEATPEHRYQVLTKRPEVVLDWLTRRGRRFPPSVWFGVTCGHPKSLPRMPLLHVARTLGARVLFVSVEPLLADMVSAGLRLDGVDWTIVGGESGTHASDPKSAESFLVGRWAAARRGDRDTRERPFGPWMPRESRANWVRALRDEADLRGSAFFFKQWGGPTPTSAGRTLDGAVHDELPEHVPGAMPERRAPIAAATAALARKLPLHP